MNAQVPASSKVGAADQVYTTHQPIPGGSGHRDVTCSVPVPTQSTRSAHILLARPSSLSGLTVAPHCSHTHSPLVIQENQTAEKGINGLQLPRGASTLWNLIWHLLCASESQNEHKRPWSHLRSSHLRSPRNKKLVFTVLPDGLGREQSQLWPTFHALSKASKNSACLLANAPLTNGWTPLYFNASSFAYK